MTKDTRNFKNKISSIHKGKMSFIYITRRKKTGVHILLRRYVDLEANYDRKADEIYHET